MEDFHSVPQQNQEMDTTESIDQSIGMAQSSQNENGHEEMKQQFSTQSRPFPQNHEQPEEKMENREKPNKDNQKDENEQSNRNEFRSLGDALKEWKEKLNIVEDVCCDTCIKEQEPRICLSGIENGR